MIEVRNLFKKYTVKNGIEVKALDDVSLKIDKVGMVFLLGKSGAGKSTLLNVLGGLDRVDSGEIIINGKSSKDFSQSDFDSYRNTYLGFIFQEYNILNEFSIAENIALAIELQGRKATNEEIDNILNQVDLVGLSKRKPRRPAPGCTKKYPATGDISPQSPSQARDAHLWTKCPEAGARLLFELVLFLRLCQLRGLFLFPLVQQSHNLFFHFGRSDLLAEIL